MSYILNILFFSIKKNYTSELSPADLEECIRKKFKQTAGTWLKYHEYFGAVENNTFNFVARKKKYFFSVRIKGEIYNEEDFTKVKASYKVISPLFVLIPLSLFFFSIYLAPQFVLNGEIATHLEKFLFSLLLFTIPTFIVILASHFPLQGEKRLFEKELKLKPENDPGKFAEA